MKKIFTWIATCIPVFQLGGGGRRLNNKPQKYAIKDLNISNLDNENKETGTGTSKNYFIV